MITSIRLQNFRSYRDESFEFDPGVNIIVGPNASGKTNLLEAVMVLARGHSYKAKDPELIKFTKPWARLDALLDDHDRSLKIERHEEKADKSFLINGKTYHRLGLERTEPVVFFEPNHLQLITRGPEQRRDFIDELLERTKPGFKTLSNNYRRALAQRNALLKRDPAFATQQLFAWNVRLGELGNQIAQARQELVTKLNKNLSRVYSQIAGKRAKLNIEYASQFPIEHYGSRLMTKLEQHTQIDMERGFTAYGPHREDIIFKLNNQLVSQSASRGETRSLLLALKALELDLVETARGVKPMLLLDDVFSELDSGRRKALVEILKNHQSIITTTDADAVIEYFDHGPKLIALTK